jgi:nicotinate-nucleotide--dimethylbenzimidazole phosphoribosyltransferase
VVTQAVETHRAVMTDPFQVLRCLGGQELAAIAGAVLAARLARTPVVLDGYACTAAAAVLQAADPGALDHCIVGHVGKRPLLDLNMRLGEASGAMLAVLLLKAAAACLNGMATFEDAGVSGPAAEENEP